MAKALNVILQVWAWLERYGAARALKDRSFVERVEERRREIVRRAAGQIGTY